MPDRLKIRPLAFLKNQIFGISPEIPYSWWDPDAKTSKGWLFALGAVPTFIFCCLTTALLAGLEGVLVPAGTTDYQGSQYRQIAFLADEMNLFFYAFLNPAIMGCGVILWLAALETRRTVAGNPGAQDRAVRGGGWTLLRLFLAVTLVVTLATLAISNYIHDVASYESAARAGTFYWFHGAPEVGKLNPLTVHYMLLNFLLLVGSLTTTGFFIPAAWRILRMGSAIQPHTGEEIASIEALKRRAAPFLDVYVTGRLIIALNMLHALIWSRNEQLSSTENKAVEFFFVLMFGIFFIVVPRYYIESEWRKVALSINLLTSSELSSADLRAGRWTRLAAHAVDTAVIGGFILVWYLSSA